MNWEELLSCKVLLQTLIENAGEMEEKASVIILSRRYQILTRGIRNKG
jgi:hypothetical protein